MLVVRSTSCASTVACVSKLHRMDLQFTVFESIREATLRCLAPPAWLGKGGDPVDRSIIAITGSES